MQAHASIVEKQEMVNSPFALAEEKFAAITVRLSSPEMRQMTHSDVERALEVDGRELVRRLLQGHMDLRAQQERELGVEGPIVGADGVVRTDLRDSDRGLMTLFGEVRVNRVAHHTPWAASLHPLDASLNLPEEKFSLGVRRRAAEEAAKGSFDEAVKSLGNTTGAQIAKRQVEELTVRAAVDFDAFYQARESLAPELVAELSDILVITTDAKGIVMRSEGLREATRKAAERSTDRLQHRLRKGEKRNRKRMAQVAAVYTVDVFPRAPEDIVAELDRDQEVSVPPRPRPEYKRVWASPDKEAVQVIREAFQEALRRDPGRTKTWVALSDGNEDQLRHLEELAVEFGVHLTIILDVIHVIEYLWKAVTAFEPEGSPEAEAWVRERLLGILRGKSSDVAAGMRRSATLRELGQEERKAVDKCADYLLKYGLYLHYHAYLAQGLPIATGVIEGACRHLVKDRMDITGARWGLAGAEAVLRLRSVRSSGDFEEYWAFHEQQEWQRNHAERYANGQVPPMRQPTPRTRGRAHLRLVD
jgi:hypothetical protein